MAEFVGESLILPGEGSNMQDDSSISVDIYNIYTQTQDLDESKGRIGSEEKVLETTGMDYLVLYEGESKSGFYQAFMVLKNKHDNLYERTNQLCFTLDENAFANSRINAMADANAGAN